MIVIFNFQVFNTLHSLDMYEYHNRKWMYQIIEFIQIFLKSKFQIKKQLNISQAFHIIMSVNKLREKDFLGTFTRL